MFISFPFPFPRHITHGKKHQLPLHAERASDGEISPLRPAALRSPGHEAATLVAMNMATAEHCFHFRGLLWLMIIVIDRQHPTSTLPNYAFDCFRMVLVHRKFDMDTFLFEDILVISLDHANGKHRLFLDFGCVRRHQRTTKTVHQSARGFKDDSEFQTASIHILEINKSRIYGPLNHRFG